MRHPPSNGYNNRLLSTAVSATSSNGTALSLSYTYFANGNVNVETNGRDNGRSVTYTYDALNRISTATSQATSGSDCWGQSFGYDRYANLTTISVTQCTAPMLSLSVNTNNQITNSGFSYDAAGDLTGDGVNTYSWNAEQHLNSAASVTYAYDGDLRRVEKSNGTLYWYCASCGKVLAESDLSGNLTSEYTFFGDQRIARRDVSSGNVYYIFSDRLGSYRTLTDASGNVKGESDYYPFGGERVISSTVTENFRFAGMEWDSEDGLNNTLYRKYTPAQGRWESPDPKRGLVSFPQGQNLYGYVKDNPTNRVDLLGDADECRGDAWITDAGCPGPGEAELDGGGGGDGGDLCFLPGDCGGDGGGCDPSDPTCDGGDSGSGSALVTCTCYLGISLGCVGIGCQYYCGCSDGTTMTQWLKYPLLSVSGGDACPGQLTWEGGGFDYYCGPTIQPPTRNPKGPRPPNLPPPPMPPPEPEPIPVP
jgi:RHS repeat-associated protein